MTFLLQTLVNGVSLGALYAMLALGIAIVFSVMRLINFAQGAVIMVAAFVVYLLADAGMWVWLPAAVIVAAALSIAVERIAFRPLRGADAASLLVASFAVNSVIQAVAQILTGSIPKSPALPPFFTQSTSLGGFTVSNLSIITIAVALIIAVALALFFRLSDLGVQMRAAAENFRMARMLGIRSNRVISLAFLISGALAGVAGVLLIVQTGSVTPAIGFQPVLVGFVAVVIGGMGSILGSALGGISIGVLSTALQAYLPVGVVDFRDAIIYTVVIVVLLFRPQGVFGTSERKA